MKKSLCILPLGATEYHGPHLCIETDWLIAQAFAAALVQMYQGSLRLHCLPVEKIGYSVEHLDHPSTQSLSYAQALERWIDIGVACYKKGHRRLLLLNAHGGNSPLMTIAATQLRSQYPFLTVATSWTRFGLPEGLISADEKSFDIHGGFLETSLMLYLEPTKVQMERAENFTNHQKDIGQTFRYLRAYGSHAFGWKMRDLNPKGAAGNASAASAKAGKAIFDHALSGLLGLLNDIENFDLAHLK
ncbi:creatininase family protein [Bartonella sp. DGB2]|uniref:creatininase family protein n=1 Tax=Bartonella sp. DGB2 TaxID=3388426 RepID=UPI00398FB17F